MAPVPPCPALIPSISSNLHLKRSAQGSIHLQSCEGTRGGEREAENLRLGETGLQVGLLVSRETHPLAKAAPQRQDMTAKGSQAQVTGALWTEGGCGQ